MTSGSDQFAHLHVHSDFSILDGHGKVGAYIQRAAELGQPAVALTDHGSLSGLYQGWKAGKEHGIKFVAGCEFYVAPRDRGDKSPHFWGANEQRSSDVSGQGSYTHLTILAKNDRGVRNLYALGAEANSTGFYRKPRIDLGVLDAHSDGLIVLSGCAGSAVSTRIRLGQYDEALKVASDLKDIFAENFFVEVMSHGIKTDDLDEEQLNRELVRLGKQLNIPLVATNDAHYCLSSDAGTHEALLAIQTQAKLSDEKRFRFNGSSFHIRSRSEMEGLSLPKEALDNTLLVAEMVESYDSVFEHNLRMPTTGSDDEGYDLEMAACEGLVARMGEVWEDIPERYVWRLNYELETINSMGYPGYFLVLAQVIRKAKERGIRIGPGRGSAGGSLVAYALGITDLDPIVHGLVFERFLNPSRKSLPDIDVDVDDARRQEFIELVRDEFGEDRVAVIGTFGTIGAKAALKDANRVLGGTFKQGAEYSGSLPPAKFGRAPTLEKYSGPKDEVYKLAVGLEGLIRNQGQHAAGVVISPTELVGELPLWKQGGQGGWVTGYDMHEIEALGFVKMDFLGLRNLGIIDDCLRMLSVRQLPFSNLPTTPEECNDQRTYQLLSSGNTLGVFQLDSPGMRGLLRLLKPTCFDDISAVLALYRPGPMGANAHIEFAHRKNDGGGAWQPKWAIHPELEETLRPVLESTYGLIVFQEQVLDCLKAVCGWDYSEAALLFDAMRKKNHEKMAATQPEFYSAGNSKGFSEDSLSALWETLVPFADYSFNRSHTAGYGLVAYWTAYFKANHPVEYMAALLGSVSDDPEKLPEYLIECERMNIKLLSPDINVSNSSFTPDGSAIRYGISAIKGVGEKAFSALASKRPYRDGTDFFRRVPVSCLNVGTLVALARSGALDSLVASREGLVEDAERLANLSTEMRREIRKGQHPLIPPRYLPVSRPLDRRLRQQWERETLGLVLSTSEVWIKPTRLLSENDLVYLKQVFESNPGVQPVTFDFGPAKLSGVASVSFTDRARRALEALGVYVEER